MINTMNNNKTIYPTSDVLKVFRAITHYLQSTPLDKEKIPMVFSTEGVFRLSGDQTKANAIIKGILNNKPLKAQRLSVRKINEFPIHDYITALKTVLRDSELLNKKEFGVEFLQHSLESESTSIEMGAQILNDTIDAWITSSNVNEQAAGEIFYCYFHLAKLALKCGKANKLDIEGKGSASLGKFIGPNFERLINADSDPRILVMLTEKLNGMCKLMLEGNTYDDEFEKKYSAEILDEKEKQLEALKAKKTTIFTKIKQGRQVKMLEGEIKKLEEKNPSSKKRVQALDEKLAELPKEMKDEPTAASKPMLIKSKSKPIVKTEVGKDVNLRKSSRLNRGL